MRPPSLTAARTLWIGIDPGFAGAIGVIDGLGRFVSVYDMPVCGGAGRSQEYSTRSICTTLAGIIGSGERDPSSVRVYLEWPTTRPDESAESSKRFGVGLGILEGVFTYAGFPPERVAPNKWKGRLGLAGKEKDPLAARQQAVDTARTFIRCLPDDTLYGPKGGLKDGRAEALLIAWEALTRTADGLRAQPEDVRLARVVFGGRGRRRKGGGPVI